MPTYEFYNTVTGEMEEHFMSYKDLDAFIEECPHLEKRVSAPQIISKSGDRTNLGGKVDSTKYYIRLQINIHNLHLQNKSRPELHQK